MHQQTLPQGASAENCAAACTAAGFVISGLEFGQECCEFNKIFSGTVRWVTYQALMAGCDSYMPLAIPAPDSDCNMVCNADKTQLCGAGNRLAVYVDSSAPPLGLQTCLNNAQLQGGNVPQFKFTLEGRYVPAFPGAPVSVPGLLGNSPQPVGANGLHLQVLTVSTI